MVMLNPVGAGNGNVVISGACVCSVLSDSLPPVDCSPPGAPLSMGFSRQEHWEGCHFLLQGIFLTQGSNPGLLHGRRFLYRLSLFYPVKGCEWGNWPCLYPSKMSNSGRFETAVEIFPSFLLRWITAFTGKPVSLRLFLTTIKAFFVFKVRNCQEMSRAELPWASSEWDMKLPDKAVFHSGALGSEMLPAMPRSCGGLTYVLLCVSREEAVSETQPEDPWSFFLASDSWVQQTGDKPGEVDSESL